MADMLNIATTSTNAFKRALEVTSHNVANVSTEGYSRQRVDIASNAPGISGLGSGAQVDSVERVYAQYLQEQLYASSGQLQRYDSQLSLSKQVEGVVASNDQGVQEFMQRFFDSLQTLANNPTSSSSRQLVLDEAQNLEGHIGNVTSVLEDVQYQTNTQIKDITKEVNERLQSIQALNERVEYAQNNSNRPPNDLLDKRDQAILEVSEYIDIKAYYHDNGSVDVYTGSGRLPLLSGNTLTRLESGNGEFTDENRQEIFMRVGGTRTEVSDYISGGQLGGMLDFREKMLDKTQQDLGTTLNGLVASTNWQHYQGYDINGDAGESVFKPLTLNALESSNNTGAEDGSNIKVQFNPNFDGATQGSEPPYSGAGVNDQPATYADKQNFFDNAMSSVAELSAREYEIKFDGTDYQFYDHKTKQQLTPIEQPGGSGRYQLDGLEFDLSSALASNNNDTFLVKPHTEILNQFERQLNDPEQLATRGQSPIDTGVAGLGDEVPAAAAVGDNVNMANLASLQSKEVLFADASGQASETLLGGYSRMATNVGSYVRSTDIQFEAQTNVHQQMIDQRDSYSGVSLDEEAANLMRFQQAYQASAQVMSTSQQLFQTLLGVAQG